MPHDIIFCKIQCRAQRVSEEMELPAQYTDPLSRQLRQWLEQPEVWSVERKGELSDEVYGGLRLPFQMDVDGVNWQVRVDR